MVMFPKVETIKKKTDHTDYMVLALQHYDVFRESILWFARYKALVGEYVALVSPTLVSQCLSVLPGFGPAAEALLVRQKDPIKVALFETHQALLTPRLASWERTDANLRRAGQLAPLKQGPPTDESVPPVGQPAGVGPWETNIARIQMKEEGTIYSV